MKRARVYLSFVALMSVFAALVPAYASSDITVYDLTADRVYQRDIGGTTKDIVLSGTYSGTRPTSVQARVVESGTNIEVLTWTTLTSANFSGGNWSGILNDVPQGGMYNIQVRDGGNTGVYQNKTNSWAVGIVVGLAGQSNAVCWYNTAYGGDTSLTADPLLFYYNGSWSHPTNIANGAIAFGNRIIEATGIPVGIILGAANSSGLTIDPYWAGYWLGPLYSNFISLVSGAGGICEYIVFIQGETDGSAGVSYSSYKAGLATLFSLFKTDIDPDIKMLISILGREAAYACTDAQWEAIINAQYDACADPNNKGMFVGATNRDNGLGSANVHWDVDGYTNNGERIAQTILYLNGYESYYRGPYISGLNKVDSTHVDVTITHRGGTDFTPNSGITGFRVFEDGSSRAVLTAVRQNAQTIRLTTANIASGTISVDYQYGRNPDITGAVHDNSPLALPLEEGSITLDSIFITLPNVIGMSETRAESALQAVGLSVGSFNSIYSNTVQASFIISQNPPAGTLVSPGSSVDLTSSLGPVPAMMTVPNVVGMTQAAAENYLSSVALLATGTVSQVYSPSISAGYVISQNPAAGTTVATYSAVDLTVSLGPAPSNVIIPDVKDMSQAAAKSALTSAGLVIGTITQSYSSTVASGKVISQSPAAGVLSLAGTVVNLTISLGPQSTCYTTVPDVTQAIFREEAIATWLLNASGFQVTKVYERSFIVPSGLVTRTDPKIGTTLPCNSTVTLYISLGTHPAVMYTVPNVVGMTQANANSALTSAGLVTGTITQAYSSTVASGSVISQAPPSGASVASGTAVNLTVSQGPQTVTIPNVVGMTQANANSALTSAGLVTGTITQAYSSTVASGNVMSQSPMAGASSLAGTAVNLTVSLGPQPTRYTTVPNVTDAMFREEVIATWLLNAFGFQVTKVYEHSFIVPRGLAIRTNPPAGSVAPVNSAVTLVISSGW